MKLLMPSEILEKSVYVVSKGETVLSVSLKLGVTPAFLIADNDLKCEPSEGQMLVIINRGKTKVLTVDDLVSMTVNEREEIKRKNGCDFLYAGQIVLK